MDPLSIAAGIIALVGATQKVAAGLNKLASLRGAPAAVLALNNELSDLRLVLSEAEPLLIKHGRVAVGTQAVTPTPTADDRLKLSIDRARDGLADLESVLQNRLMTRMGKFDRLGWLMEQEKVRKALHDLRTVRLNITAMLGVVTSSVSFRLETRLQDVQIANQESQAMMSQALSSQKDTVEKAFAYIIASQEKYDERLEKVEASVAAKNELSENLNSGDAAPPAHTVTRRQSSNSQRSLPRVNNFSALRLRFLQQRKCELWCDCDCHTIVRARTPDMLQPIFGALFLGYAGLPALTPSCSKTKCRRGSEGFLQLNYYFPQWFVARTISMVLRFQDAKIPKISMRVLNVRDTYEDIFRNAHGNDADLVAYQLTSGQASVIDVTNDSGHSPLHIAVCNSNVEVIKVLLQRGAEPYLENRTQETPYDMAWNTIFCFQGTPNASAWRVDEIRALFPTVNFVEERRRFTRIHKIILQILHLNLDNELAKNRSMVTELDADGRTALSWAAARGDSKSVEALLRHGASPDTPDRIGQGPLRQAMKAHDPTCAKLLLAYGAKADQRDNWKQTALQSAMYYPDPVPFVIPLLEAGAEVNVFDSQGHSPLMEAMSENHADAVKILLDHGAETDRPNNVGCTALHQGVRYNSHKALAVLLGFEINHAVRDKRKRTVLHWAAEYADLQTLNLLRLERLQGLNAHDRCENGSTAIDIAENRGDQEAARGSGNNTISSEWITAFSDLLESLVDFNTPRSALSYTGSAVSEDFFVDALHTLKVEELAELAEGGAIPHTAEFI